MQTSLIAGTSLEPVDHNVTGNGERDGLKIYRIGRSAAKLLKDTILGEGSTTSREAYPQVRGNGKHPDVQDGDMVLSVLKDTAVLDDHYVYILLDPRKQGHFVFENLEFKNQPFYVGLGHSGRIYSHEEEARYTRKCRITPKVSKIRAIWKSGMRPIKVILVDSLSRPESEVMEKGLIKLIGRKDLGTGLLVNMTDGGDGVFGRFGKMNPMSGNGHRVSGKKNGMYGIHGKDHHAFGKANYVSMMTEDERQAWACNKSEEIKAWWRRISEEEKAALSRKYSEAQKRRHASMSDEKRKEISKKQSEARKRYWASKSKEERKRVSAKASKAAMDKWNSLSEEDRKVLIAKRVEKQKLARAKRLAKSKS